MRGTRGIFATLAALVVVLVVFELTELDLRVQDRLFDFERGAWRVDSAAPLPRAVFYRLPKVAVPALAFGALGLGLLGVCPRREALYLFAVLALVPLLTGGGKRLTGVYCPSEVDRYGGPMPYIRLFESVPPEVAAVKRGRCFPAAHASGGFAFVALAFLGRRRTSSALWGLGAGGVMGCLARGCWDPGYSEG